MYYGLDSRGYGISYESDDPYGPDHRPRYERAAFYEGAEDERDVSGKSSPAPDDFRGDVPGFSVLRKQRVYEQRQEARATQEPRISDEERRGARSVLGSAHVIAGGDEGAGRRDRVRLR